MKLEFKELIRILKETRQRIKRKRFLLDESQDKFGLVELKQLNEVKNEKEIKGYPFYGKNKKGTEIGIKIVPIEKKYNKNNHPAMLECMFLRELTDNIVNKNVSPHIVYYFGYQKVSNSSKAIRFLNLKKFEIEDIIRSNSNMLISEYVQGGSLDNWIYTTYENKEKISDKQWKILVFQLIYTIYIFQKHYKLMHNDCHYGNILIDNTVQAGGYFVYKLKGKKFYIPNTGIIPKFFDFEFSMSYNKKMDGNYSNAYITNGETETDSSEEYNVPETYNEVYDTHYLLTSLLDLYISEDLFDWIIDLYPEELIPEDKDKTTITTTEQSYTSNEVLSSLNELTMTMSSETQESSNLKSSNSTYLREYLLDGRLINGTENLFKLPTALELLNNEFFKEFLDKPSDISTDNCIIFDCEN
jgi:hypothetical protein